MWIFQLFGFVLLLVAQTGEPSIPGLLPITAQEVQTALSELQGEDPATKEQREMLERAATLLNQAQELHTQAEQYKSETLTAPTRRQALEEQLQNTPSETTPEDLNNLPLNELVARLVQPQADLTQLREDKASWRSRADARPGRIAALPDEIAKTKQEAHNHQEALAALAPDARLSAQGAKLLAQAQWVKAKLEVLEAELRYQESQRDLDPLLADRFQRQERVLEAKVAGLQDHIAEQRNLEAEATRDAAKRRALEIQSQFPRLASVAEANERLAAMRTGPTGLPQRIASAKRALVESRERMTEIESRFESTAKRMKIAGLTESMGRVLRRDFEWLDNPRELRRRDREFRNILSECELQFFDMDEQIKKRGDPDLAYQTILASLGTETPSEELVLVSQKLVTHQRELQDNLFGDLDTLSKLLTELQKNQNLIATNSNLYRAYIESRILWVQSAQSLASGGMNALPKQAWAWGTSWIRPGTWRYLFPAIESKLGVSALTALLLLILLVSRPFLRRKREEMTKGVRSRRSDRFVLTVRALMQTLFLTLWLPLLLWYLGTILLQSAVLAESARLADLDRSLESNSILGQGMGTALVDYAGVVWVLYYLFELVLEKGIGEIHFRWNPQTTALVRRHLRWFIPPVVLCGLIYRSLHSQDLDSSGGTLDILGQSQTLGRLAFTVAMLCLAIFLRAMGQKDSPLWTQTLQRKPGLMIRVHSLWTTAAVLTPLALIVIALLGYYYTALKLEEHLVWSFAMGLGLVLVHSLLLRWLNITRWKLAVAQAREKAKQRASAPTEAVEGSESTIFPIFDEAAVDLPALDTQTRQLFQSGITLTAILGLYFIWASALPALKGLDSVQLWPELRILSTEENVRLQPIGLDRINTLPMEPSDKVQNSGSTATESFSLPSAMPLAAPNEPASPNAMVSGLPSSLTLGDVILAILILLLMGAAARNLPGLLEISLLQRLPLDSGSRYAIATLVRYLIFIVGISAASSTLGLGWDRVQWLVAAVTFALAFGLQEIFANFVSGLIILLERTVRVGDVVTVGTIEGVVTRLRMRATTVQDWDRRELLVPNKEFITSSVINWTLTDPITRVILKVGIAYGANVEKARSILLKIAKDSTYVVDSPSPSVVFRSFGDSTLDLELRVFIGSRDHWPMVVDTINCAIDRQFRDAGIEIAFPQRDLHIRSGLEVLGHQANTANTPGAG